MTFRTKQIQRKQNNQIFNSTSEKASVQPASLFFDNRPEMIAQRKLQEMADRSTYAMETQSTLPDASTNSIFQLKEDKDKVEVQFKAETAQLRADEFLQRKFKSEQNRPTPGPFRYVQRKSANPSRPIPPPFQFAAYQAKMEAAESKPNKTGMPDKLKSGIENLSGFSMDDVKVHYNSPKPAQLQAHAYAQGTDIHMAPGQEKHLPHEAWHVVQQKQGRVKPTMQLKEEALDNGGIEKITNKKEIETSQKPPSVLHNSFPSEQTSIPIQKIAVRNSPALEPKASNISPELTNLDSPALSSAPTNIIQCVYVKIKDEIKNLTVDGALDKLIEAELMEDDDITEEFVAALEEIDDGHKKEEAFESLELLFAAITSTMEAADEAVDAAPAAIEWNINLWQSDEDPEEVMHGNCLSTKYTMGDSVREGMDYKTVDKDAYSVDEDEDLALVIRFRRPGGAGTLWGERNTLLGLARREIPTAEIIEIGHYVIDNCAYPAMIMKLYFTSSKTIARMKDREPTAVKGSKEHLELAFATVEECKAGIDSLVKIESGLRKCNCGVDDIQFLIDDEGNFAVNDASQTDKKFLESNLYLINYFKGLLEERKTELE